ncbi:MFS transporter [Streptomyces albus]|uniref:MFS transporter n=1 Tax=Streptomyces albus TaxID=1888 RepID=UPI00099B7731|nr:MFS transporter [Streptomyces albus]
MPARILPPAGPPRRLALAQLVNSVGDGAYYVCSTLYFARIAGLPPALIGLGLTLAWAAAAPAGILLGHLADRRGPRTVSALLAAATGLAVAGFLLVRSFPAFVATACLYAICQSGLAASRQALLAGLVPPAARTGVLAHLQSTLNAGLAAGAALGGIALHLGTPAAYRAALALDAAGFLLCALLLLTLPPVAPTPAGPAPRGGARLAVLRDRPYALVTLLQAVMLLRMPLISIAIPLWIAERTAAPGSLTALLMLLNTLAVTLFQVRIARHATGLGPAVRLLRRSGPVMLAACAVFAAAAAPATAPVAAALLCAAAVLLVTGEMMQSAGAWQIAFGLAPEGRQGQYQGFFGSATAVARMAGPVLLTALTVNWGPPGWLLLGGLFLLAGTAMGPVVRRASRIAVQDAPAQPAPHPHRPPHGNPQPLTADRAGKGHP